MKERTDVSSDMQGRLLEAREQLQARAVLAHGLTEGELSSIERLHGFVFPPDLRFFLGLCMPVSARFPDWREPSSVQGQLTWPSEGIVFDIRQSNYWRAAWGVRPMSMDDAVATALEKLGAVPKLIPIVTHCYLPADPCLESNPVFSVYQTDVIHRGNNLAEFLQWFCYEGDKDDIEATYPPYSSAYRYIRFWTDLAKENYE